MLPRELVMNPMKLIALAGLLVMACHESQPPEPPPPPPPPELETPPAEVAPQQEAQTPPRSETSPPITGALSEEEFKKLHELKSGEVPELHGADLHLPTSAAAYLSLPEAAEPPLPAVLVVHEWWGLNDHIKHYADRIAANGYAALAIDLFKGKVATTPDQAMGLVKSLDPKRARAVIEDALGYLSRDQRILAQKRGSIGWCFGGKWSLEAALVEPSLDATVIYYGQVPRSSAALEGLRTPILAFFGKQDASIPAEQVKDFEAALDQLGVEHHVVTYDAGHAFANPSGARYNAEAADAAWKQTLQFLNDKLKQS